MENSVSMQMTEFLYSGLLGIGIGVMFDIFRLGRTYTKRKAMSTLLDVMFWGCATVCLLVFVLTVSEGRMRWYVLFGAFCGTFVYLSALSEIVFKVMLTLVSGIQKLLRLMMYPVKIFLRWGLSVIKASERKTEEKIRSQIRKKRLKRRRTGKNGGKKEKKKQGDFS